MHGSYFSVPIPYQLAWKTLDQGPSGCLDCKPRTAIRVVSLSYVDGFGMLTGLVDRLVSLKVKRQLEFRYGGFVRAIWGG